MPYRNGMKFTLQEPSSGNLVRACTADGIVVREHVIRSSVILTAAEIVFDWPPARIEELTPQHLQAVLQLKPDVILLGTGARQVFPDAIVLAESLRAGVGLEVMDTRAACRTYNVLVQEGRSVAAALIVERRDNG
jgi:uncharacterized protein